MANFTVTNTTAMGGGNSQTVITANYMPEIVLYNSTAGTQTVPGILRRGKLYDLLVGTAGTPADTYIEWECVRTTIGATVAPELAGGISSLSSNFGLDPGDNGTAANSVFINSSVTALANATFTTELWYVGVNQRASYRWVAAPGSEMVWPAATSATGNNGVAVRARGTAAVNATTTVMWAE